MSDDITCKVTNIIYNVDGNEEDAWLPKSLTIVVPSEEDEIEEYLSDEISNITGFCHESFAYTVL